MIDTASASAIDNYGLPITFLLIVISFAWYMLKTHKSERNEWRQDSKQNIDRYDERQKETTEVMRQLTSVIERGNKK